MSSPMHAAGEHGPQGAHVESMYRNMPPYGQPATLEQGDGNLFRRRITGVEWGDTAALGGQDPRLTPSGDIARRGSIPAYVPFAVLNPAHIVNVPQ